MQNYVGIGIAVASAVIVLIMMKHGFTEKLFAASALFLRLMISFVVAMTFYHPLAHLVTRNFSAASEYVAIRVIFLVLLWGTYLILTELFERRMEPEHVILPNVVDRAGGVIFGALSGAVLVGLLLLTWAFLPYVSRVGPFPTIKPVDMGEVLIHEYANLSVQTGKSGTFNPHKEIDRYHSLYEPAAPPAPAAGESPAPSAPAPSPSKKDEKPAGSAPSPKASSAGKPVSPTK